MLVGNGKDQLRHGRIVDSDMHDVGRFLNRLLGIRPEIQNRCGWYIWSILTLQVIWWSSIILDADGIAGCLSILLPSSIFLFRLHGLKGIWILVLSIWRRTLSSCRGNQRLQYSLVEFVVLHCNEFLHTCLSDCSCWQYVWSIYRAVYFHIGSRNDMGGIFIFLFFFFIQR